MREAMTRCIAANTSPELDRRLSIELATEELESELKSCVEIIRWDINKVSPGLRKLAE